MAIFFGPISSALKCARLLLRLEYGLYNVFGCKELRIMMAGALLKGHAGQVLYAVNA